MRGSSQDFWENEKGILHEGVRGSKIRSLLWIEQSRWGKSGKPIRNFGEWVQGSFVLRQGARVPAEFSDCFFFERIGCKGKPQTKNPQPRII